MRSLLFYRPIVKFACMGGQNLSPESEFAGQRAVADEVLAWYRQYVELLRRLRSGRTPTICGGFLWPGWCIRGSATRWWSLPRAGYSGPTEVSGPIRNGEFLERRFT